jgi:GPH family glycoside/pentoside/hexuronide:cation symporter
VPAPAIATPPQAVPQREKIAFGCGAVIETGASSAFGFLANPVYQITLGMNPIWVGVVLTVMRIWDAITDPVMGSISDNHRSRFGRRRPFVFVGALLSALSFPLVWMAGPGWGENAHLSYFLVTAVAYITASTIFSIPYYSLGLERTQDYHEKTRLWSFRAAVIPLITVGLNWSYALAQSAVFQNPIEGFRVFAIGFGLLMLVTGILPALLVSEGPATRSAPPAKVPLWASARATLQCRPFLLIGATIFLVLVSSHTMGQLGLYLKLFYVYSGDTKAGAVLGGWVGTVYQAAFLAFVPMIVRLSVRVGKRNALILCFACQILGDLSKFVSYDPRWPYLVLITAVLVAPGAAGMATLLPSMISDLCDWDELRTGTRREGMFSAITNWLQKVGFSITGVLSGVVLVWSGFDIKLGGNQAPGTFLCMLFWLCAAPAGCTILACLLMRRYTLSEVDAAGVRAQLEERRRAAIAVT